MPRTGRRAGDSGARAAILQAARHSFGTVGFRATTIRGVAREAAVDPALVHHYYGTKTALFAAALELPADPAVVVPQLLAGGVDGLGERLVTTFLRLWDAAPGHGPVLALLRSAVSDDAAAHALRETLVAAVLQPLTTATGAGDAEWRASLLASQMSGLLFARFVLRLEPLASASPEQVAAAVGPTVDRYLTGQVR